MSGDLRLQVPTVEYFGWTQEVRRRMARSDESIVDKLETWVERHPTEVAMRFVERPRSAMVGSTATTFEDLLNGAVRVAGKLQAARVKHGDRALLLLPPGPRYVESFFGCLYSGVIAVPLYPPGMMTQNERLRSVARNSAAAAMLVTAATVAKGVPASLTCGETIKVIAVDEGEDDAGRPVSCDAGVVRHTTDIAFLQYTSGSTGDPRGVMVSHANVLANIGDIGRCLAVTPEDREVSWLPPYHDMGLIAGLLQPILDGIEVVAMSPATFARDPLLWLRCFETFGGTYGGAPNFAYEMCVKRAEKDGFAGDLSSWRAAFCGAEPIRADTLERFSTLFSGNGLQPTLFRPAYGLAEATLFVTGRPPGLLETAQLSPSGQEGERDGGGSIVNVGSPPAGTTVEIVDPVSRIVCDPGAVGEIWVSGPGVAGGYWNRDAGGNEIFAGRLAGDRVDVTYLRTGDLGFCVDRHLFVTGRLKDLIIIRGQNVYPQDIEATIEDMKGTVALARAAAFTIDTDEGEGLGVVVESRKGLSDSAVDRLAAEIMESVVREHGVRVALLAVAHTGQVQRTSSGKIRRSATKAALLDGSLKLYGTVTDAVIEGSDGGDSALVATITAAFASVLPAGNAGPGTNFFAAGGDSLALVEVATILDEAGFPMEPEMLLEYPTPLGLAAEFKQLPLTGGLGVTLLQALRAGLRAPIAAGEDTGSQVLNPTQRRWATNYLSDRQKSWGNVPWAITLLSRLEPAVLESAVGEVWRRHDSLRTRFVGSGAHLRSVVDQHVDVPLRRISLEDFNPLQAGARTAEIRREETRALFDLESGPLSRIALLAMPGGTSMIMGTTHHMVADGWSINLLDGELRRELARALGLLPRGDSADEPVRYRDYSRWYTILEESGALEASRQYWREEMACSLDGPPMRRPPTDATNFGGRAVRLRLQPRVVEGIKRLVAAQVGSFASVVMAAMFEALRREYDVPDIVIGTPLAGRDRKDLRNVIGMFINNVPIRTRASDHSSRRELLATVQEKLVLALTHQRWQLDRMAEDVGWSGDLATEFPFTNIFFSDIRLPGKAGDGVPLEMTVSPLDVDVRFQAMVYCVHFDDEVVLEWRYRDTCYGDDEVLRLMQGLQEALSGAVDEIAPASG